MKIMERNPHYVFSVAFYIVRHHFKQNDNRKNVYKKITDTNTDIMKLTYIYYKLNRMFTGK